MAYKKHIMITVLSFSQQIMSKTLEIITIMIMIIMLLLMMMINKSIISIKEMFLNAGCVETLSAFPDFLY